MHRLSTRHKSGSMVSFENSVGDDEIDMSELSEESRQGGHQFHCANVGCNCMPPPPPPIQCLPLMGSVNRQEQKIDIYII